MNINMWVIMLPAFVIEGIFLGYLFRNLRSSRLSTFAVGIISLLHGAVFFLAVWHDSYHGIIQLAEDLTSGSESPIAALLFIAFGTVVVAGLVAFGHMLIVSIAADKFARYQRNKLLASKRISNVAWPKAPVSAQPSRSSDKIPAKTPVQASVQKPVRKIKVNINYLVACIKAQIGDKTIEPDEMAVIYVPIEDDKNGASA